ncbi:hypothetical protein RSAG8_00577, partial [Rhizoctonia solani AG-8 WAC10335]
MQLIGRRIDKDGVGYVTLVPQDDEDMWHIYNLIQEGDQVRAAAVRRVQSVTATGSTSSERVHLHLTLRVTKVEFSSSSNSAAAADVAQPTNGPVMPTANLSISGRVSEENRHVKMGAFHTLDLEAHRNVKIIKEYWDSIALQRVEEAIVPGRGAEVGAIVCGEGTAAICLLSEHMTVIRQRIEVPVPRKRMGSSTLHEKRLAKHSTKRSTPHSFVTFPSSRSVSLLSPARVLQKIPCTTIFSRKPRVHRTRRFSKPGTSLSGFMFRAHTCTAWSTYSRALRSTYNSKKLNLHEKGSCWFFKMLGDDEMRAWYGPDHVVLAADRGAIGTLLISDELFRSGDVNERKKYVALVESVRKKRGEVLIFSSMHETGQQLNQLTGVAAILTFPLDVEVVEAEEQAAKDEEEARAREEAKGADQG